MGKRIKATILGIQKRNFIMRILSINHWKVHVECNGQIYSLNVWAGVYTHPRLKFLLSDLKRELKKKLISEVPEIEIDMK